jgi:Peptidase A4 family
MAHRWTNPRTNNRAQSSLRPSPVTAEPGRLAAAPRHLARAATRGLTACVALALLGFALTGTASAAVAHHPATTSIRPGTASAHSFRPGGLLVRPAGAARSAARAGRYQEVESTNWSGYAVTGSDGAFTSVSASWTQPTATCTSSGSKRGRGGSDKYAAFWVGLDGYSSDSVEQTGSDSDCDGTTPDYYGWYEMYPADPVYYTNTVKPGDSMSASVTFSGTETYTLVLKDATQGWTETVTKNETGLDRSSAEVITEAPSSSSGVLPLADFGTVNYTAATANGTSMGTQSPTEIIMVDNSGAKKDSTSSMSSAGAFSNTWITSS